MRKFGGGTVPKIFEKFPKHLEEYHKYLLMEIIDGLNKTVASFNVYLDKFKEKIFEGHQYEEQMDYPIDLRIPAKMEPIKCLLKIHM